MEMEYEIGTPPGAKEQTTESNKGLFMLLVKGIIKLMKFSLYLVISFLKALINVIECLFLKDYKPFKAVTDARETKKQKKIKLFLAEEKKKNPYAIVTHNYEFKRSETFGNNYAIVTERIKQASEHQIVFDEKLTSDTIKRIDLIVLEAEKQALKDGYAYAKVTKYKLDNDYVYDDFIQDKILRGE